MVSGTPSATMTPTLSGSTEQSVLAITGGGVLSTVETTVLLTVDETMELPSGTGRAVSALDDHHDQGGEKTLRYYQLRKRSMCDLQSAGV